MGVSFAANSSETVPEAAKATSAARKAARLALHMWFSPTLGDPRQWDGQANFEPPLARRQQHAARQAERISNRASFDAKASVSPNGTISFETSLLRDPGKISASGASPIPNSSRNAAASSSVAIGSVTTGCPTKSQDMPALCIKGGSNGKSAKT